MLSHIILGIVQGLTEFLPVSSSAHLVFAEKMTGRIENDVAFFVFLHLGTLLALVVFFFKDILALFKNPKLIGFILLATLITGVIGVLGRNYFKSLFESVSATSWQLLVNGFMLIVANRFISSGRNAINFLDSIIFGFVQAISIVPGISRSGATISALLFRKVDKETAFKFSFLASMPAILGAALLEAKDIGKVAQINIINFSLGFLFSFIAGLFSLYLVHAALKKAKLHYYGYYCIIVAILTITFLR